MPDTKQPPVTLSTQCNHDLADPFIRAWHFTFVGHQRFGERELYSLWNCRHCGSTKSLTIVASDPGEDFEDETKPGGETPPLSDVKAWSALYVAARAA